MCFAWARTNCGKEACARPGHRFFLNDEQILVENDKPLRKTNPSTTGVTLASECPISMTSAVPLPAANLSGIENPFFRSLYELTHSRRPCLKYRKQEPGIPQTLSPPYALDDQRYSRPVLSREWGAQQGWRPNCLQGHSEEAQG